jgi:hypothetical protein
MKARHLKTPAAAQRGADGTTRGRIVGWERDRGILVAVGTMGEVKLAQSLIALDQAELEKAVEDRHPVLLTYEDHDPARPVILGLLAPVPASPRSLPAVDPAPPTTETVERVDGDDVVIIRGRDSLELRCGASSIVLRKDGKIVLRGKYILSRALNENRIVGGSVHFN